MDQMHPSDGATPSAVRRPVTVPSNRDAAAASHDITGAADLSGQDEELHKAASENFPVAPFFLPASVREDVLAVYGFARLVDDIGDGDLPAGRRDAELLGVPELDVHSDGGSPSQGAEGNAPQGPPSPKQRAARLHLLDALERDLLRVFDDGEPRHPLVRRLRRTVRRHAVPADPFRRLIEANRQDQRVSRYGTFDELLDYCALSANPVGELVLRLFDVYTPARRRMSDAVCGALQVIEHLQDVAEDLAVGRIYLPADDLRRFGVTEADLAGGRATPAVRALLACQAARARGMLYQGLPLVGTVDGRLRLLLAGFVGGGRAQLRALEAADHDVLPGPPKASKARVAAEVARLTAPGRWRRGLLADQAWSAADQAAADTAPRPDVYGQPAFRTDPTDSKR